MNDDFSPHFLFTFVLALPNNVFSFFTICRRSCLRQGVRHYLLAMRVQVWVGLQNKLTTL